MPAQLVTAVLGYLLAVAAISVLVVLRPSGQSRHWRPARLRRRLVVGAALFFVLLPAVMPALPPGPLSWLAPRSANAGELLNSPEYVGATVLPNGEAGLIFKNDMGAGLAETRFKGYFTEHGMNPSQQLSTASSAYPQIASFQGKVIAAYVDNRSGPTQSQLLVRISPDNGASWGAEFTPFGAETFDSGNSAPLLVTSRDGSTLYFFNCCASNIPQYRTTTDPTLLTWTTPAAAGDASMRWVSGNACGDAPGTGQECRRAHSFEFTETATAGQWVYIAKSDSGWGQSGRGTQVGTLGPTGAWSAQVDHGGSGGNSGGGESRATAFLDRAGNVIYVRAGELGNYVYYKKSSDGGFTWGAAVQAFDGDPGLYTTSAPVGLYLPGYTRGEYVWYAAFGGPSENTMRVTPLWAQPTRYPDSGTVRLFGTLGGDWDFGTAYPYTFGRRDIPTGVGAYKTSAEDLAIPGRLLNFSLSRSYSSADVTSGPLGPGWTHNLNWSLVENTPLVEVRRGDGRSDYFTRNPDGTYAPPPNVFDVLTKNADGSFTLTTREQVMFEFAGPRSAYANLALTDNPAGFWSLDERSGLVMADQKAVQDGTTNAVGRGSAGIAGTLASSFDGRGYATIPSVGAFNFGTADYTVEAWVYRTGSGSDSWPMVISKRAWQVANEPGWAISLPTADPTKVAVHVNNRDFGDAGQQTASGLITANAWHHIALVYTALDLTGRVYVDGSLALTTPVTDGTSGATNSAAIVLGRNNAGNGDYYAGRIDEVAIYPSALPAARIAAHYQANTVPAYAAPAGKLMRIHEPASNQLTLNYGAAGLSLVTDSVGRVMTLGYTSGTNLARGRPYTSVPTASWGADAGLVALTDGNLGEPWSWHDGPGLVDFTLDLGTVQPLALARSYYDNDTAYGIFKPVSVEILTSTDNSTYTSRGSTPAASAVNTAGLLWRYDLALSTSARYVRFHVTATPGASLQAGELEAYLSGFTPPLAQAGTNVGAAKTYAASVAPSASYPDSGGTELTDSTLGNSAYYDDGSWQGHQNLGATPLDVTLDLGSAQRVGVTRSFHFHYPADGVYRPARIELLTSTDNSLYTSRGATVAAAAVNDSLNRWRYEFDLGGVSARYVRFRLTAGGPWLFSSEMQVFAEGAGPVSVPSGYGERLTVVQDSSGRRVTYGYDQNGRLSAVVDKIGNAAGQDPVLHTWHYSYDAQTQHIAAVIDPDSRTRVTNTYNGEGRLATQRDGAGNSSSFSYGSQITMVTDPRGHLVTQLFDPRWRLESQSEVVNLENYLLQYFYEDAWENLTRTIDRSGNETIFEYDDRGNVITKTDPVVPPNPTGYVTRFWYDTRNNLTRILDARGFETINTYNSVTNVKESTKQQITIVPTPTYALTKWQYLDGANPGLPTRIISPRGDTDPLVPNYIYSQALSYDVQGNLVQRIDADSNKTTFGYDGLSRQTTMVDPDGYFPVVDPASHTWTTVYDENDRVKEAKDPLSHSVFSGYDSAGDRTSATDRSGNITTYAYDGAARLLSVKQKPDPVGQPSLVYTTSVTQRDGNGNATQVTQDQQGTGGANTVVTDYGYDEINRLTSTTTHPTAVLNLTTSYILDHNGNTTRRTTADAVQTNYQYDALSRLNQVSAAGLATISYSYDELSHRRTMTDGTGPSTYSYDGLGRITQAVQPNGTLGYGYDLDSNRTTLSYPTVGSVSYVFSPAGRLANLTDWGSRVSAYTYSAAGLAKTVTVPGGMTTTYGYDNAQRLTSLVNATGAGTITSDTYTLDNEGNRTVIDELMPPVVFASAKVNSDAGTTVQDHPAIALGNETPSPASYLIWDDARDGNANIYFAKRDPATGAWSNPQVKVNNDTGTRVQVNPAISLDSANNAYAVWEDSRDGGNTKIDTNIYSSKRAAGGSTWTANTKVNDDTSQNPVQRNPRIAGTAAGIETAVWVDLRASQNNIYASQLNLPGCSAGLWCPNKRVTDNTTALKDFPDVAVDSANTAYAVWQDSRLGNIDIYFSSLTNGVGTWAANVKISDDPGTAAQTKPRIGVDSAGNLTAAWIDARTSPAHVRVARRPAAGAWSASIDITPTPANVQSLALSVRADGFAWAVWGDTRAGAANQDVWGARYDPALNTWSAAVRLDDDGGTSANQSSPAVAFGPAETVLSWRDNRLSANGDTQARRVQVISGMTDHFALSYDGLNRLKSVGGPVSESFALDGPSNVTNRSGTTEAYDKANRLIDDGAVHNTWSDADRLTNRGTDTFGYDPLDRITSSNVAGTARTYTYNGDGLLQTRTGGVGASFLWDAATAPNRQLKQGNDNIIYGLGPLYVVKADATTLTFARDGSKNVRGEVNSSGAVTSAFRYRAYGQLAQATSAAPTYLGLASQLIDSSGLYYMRARWYDPVTGRFVTHDPLSGSSTNPATLNAYGYAGGDPILSADPSGLAFTSNADGGGKCDADCVHQVALDRLWCGLCRIMLFGARAEIEPPGEDGVTIVKNAGGLMGWITWDVGVAGSLWQNWAASNTITWSQNLIVSNSEVLDKYTRDHEYGHVSQAKQYGATYLPRYLVGMLEAPINFASLNLTGHQVDLHFSHPMERDAEFRADHDDPWHANWRWH